MSQHSPIKHHKSIVMSFLCLLQLSSHGTGHVLCDQRAGVTRRGSLSDKIQEENVNYDDIMCVGNLRHLCII